MGNNSYSLLRDIKLMLKISTKYPTSFSYYRMFKEEMAVSSLPPICGRIFMGRVYLMFTSVEHLQDLYINKNQIADKYYASRWNFWRLIPDSILFQPG